VDCDYLFRNFLQLPGFRSTDKYWAPSFSQGAAIETYASAYRDLLYFPEWATNLTGSNFQLGLTSLTDSDTATAVLRIGWNRSSARGLDDYMGPLRI
jgi:hypothetical protein